MKKIVGIIGCGNMGAAIAKAVPRSMFQVLGYDNDKKKLKYVSKTCKLKIAGSNIELVKECSVIIVAVKPKDVIGIVSEIGQEFNSSKLLISIAAGISTKSIENGLLDDIAVIRAMPNMPALIGAGVSAICKGRFVKNSDLILAKELLRHIGEVVEVKERLMDAVTAISGSGPAYFFYLTEVLIRQAVEFGIKEDVARRLVVETALGSARLLKVTNERPESLRAKVTSKGGTTEAAFLELFANNLVGILKKALNKALKRAEELSKNL